MQSSTITSFYLLILPKLPETQHLRSTFVHVLLSSINFHKSHTVTGKSSKNSGNLPSLKVVRLNLQMYNGEVGATPLKFF